MIRKTKISLALFLCTIIGSILGIGSCYSGDDPNQERINLLQNRMWVGGGSGQALAANLNDMAEVSRLRSQQYLNKYNLFKGDCGCCCCEPGIKRTITCILITTLVGVGVFTIYHLLTHSSGNAYTPVPHTPAP